MTQKYFQALNYTLGNEDTTLEYEMVKKLQPKEVFAVTGAGSRSLPLLQKSVVSLNCVDVSINQLYLTELREKTILKLSLDQYKMFWGFYPYRDNENKDMRRDIFSDLGLSLGAADYFNTFFEDQDWISPLYQGKWEKTFILFSKMVPNVLGPKAQGIFEHFDRVSQTKYYQTQFPMNRWKFLLTILGNKSMFNALLYKGDFIQKNIPETHFQFYFNAFERLMTVNLARESFFLNLCFKGAIGSEDANTIETKERCFKDMKESLESGSKVNYLNKDILSAVKSLKNLDFVSLSDVPSYFTGDLEKNFLQDFLPSIAKGGIVVIRYYLRICEADESGYEDVTVEYTDLIRQEKVQMYKIKVLKKI